MPEAASKTRSGVLVASRPLTVLSGACRVNTTRFVSHMRSSGPSFAEGKFCCFPIPKSGQPIQCKCARVQKYAFPLSFPQKPSSVWPPQVADHLIPNQVLGFFEFFRERERGKFSVFKGLQKPLSAQIQDT